ncbi:PREDICTED: dynactin subunit 6 [Tinamus guttatus]|nr:PREDICTED: dynactin subunit 6 [Tinamus guttatus]
MSVCWCLLSTEQWNCRSASDASKQLAAPSPQLPPAGPVSAGLRTVIHPKARIIAEAGPIVIGEGNLIEEQALIINGYPENITPETEEVEPKPMVIGTNNVFEVGCYSQAMKVGDNNVIESKAFVGRNVILTSGCIIGACCKINTYEVIPENTVIYGADCLRRVQTERPQRREKQPLSCGLRSQVGGQGLWAEKPTGFRGLKAML